MKTVKRIVCIIVCAAIIAGAAVFVSGAQPEYKNAYPYVFIHGLDGWGSNEGINDIIPYWGATTGDLMEYLSEEGYECRSASVGPISSTWDRACELYAQLAGCTVDYGAAHSAQNNHLRYGRTYSEPLVDNWGELDIRGKIRKVNLIGHSFGGTTARLLVSLLKNGSAEELAATTDGSISGLFTGGKGDWVESVTTICTPHNSSTAYKFVYEINFYETFRHLCAFYTATAGRTPLNGTYFDFHLEQFGMTNTPGEHDADGYFKSIARFLSNTRDAAQYELTPWGAQEVNDMIEINEDVYYFSYAFSTTQSGIITDFELPVITTNPVLSVLSLYMGLRPDFKDSKTGREFDGEWHQNDGLVNTASAKYPFDEPHTDYDGSPRRGEWNVMPVRSGDHGAAIGLFADKQTTQTFYLELAIMLNALK